jgi:carboxypeptidase C (cathepsin A)
MVTAIEVFYGKFPELKDQDLYLTGEQYTGITIPMIANMIIKKNNNLFTPSW